MLTLEEQLTFLEQERKNSVETLKTLKEQFGTKYSHIFTEKIGHSIFCYDSVLASLRQLQNINK